MPESSNLPVGGAERRAFPRYRLVRPLTGVIEHAETRFPGSVLDVSVSGFLLYLPGGDGGRFLRAAGTDFGEVAFGEASFGGFGTVAGVRKLAGGPGIGFRWDDYVYRESRQAIDQLLASLAQQRQAGCVLREGEQIRVCGHLSVALSVDLHAAVAAGADRLSLAETSSLDSSGVNLLLDLKKAGVCLDGPLQNGVRETLERFRVLG